MHLHLVPRPSPKQKTQDQRLMQSSNMQDTPENNNTLHEVQSLFETDSKDSLTHMAQGSEHYTNITLNTTFHVLGTNGGPTEKLARTASCKPHRLDMMTTSKYTSSGLFCKRLI